MKKPKRTFLKIGLILSTLLVTALLCILLYELFFVYDFPSHNPYDGSATLQYYIDVLIAIVVFYVCCVICSFLKIGILRKLRGAILTNIILDVAFAVIIFVVLYTNVGDASWPPDLSIYVALVVMGFISFVLAATFSALGYANIVKEIKALENDKNPQRFSSSAKPIHRPLIFWGELIATVTFGLLACFDFFVSIFVQRSLDRNLMFLFVVLIASNLFSAMGIRISLLDQARYQKRRGFVLVSVITCLIVGTGFLVFAFIFSAMVLMSWPVILACLFIFLVLVAATILILIDYVKANKELSVLVAKQKTLGNIAESIAKFDELRKSGAITQEEFDAIKAKNIEKIK